MTNSSYFFKNNAAKLLALGMVLCTLTGFFHYYVLYYIVLGLTFLLLLFHPYDIRVGDRTTGLFLLACLFSLLLNGNIPSYFRVWERLSIYVAVVIIVGPLFVNSFANKLRTKLLIHILNLCVLLSVASFIGFFFGINFMERHGDLLEIGVGSFSGFMNHSIYLGLFAGLSATYSLAKTMAENRKARRFLWALITIGCLGACVLSSSRNGVASGLVGCLVVVFSWFRKNKSKAFRLVLVITILGVASFPIWGGLTDFLVQKQMGNQAMGGALFSRERKIEARIVEFKRSPIYGIGYNVIDPRLDAVNKENGQIEPGSSWLELASMTGIIGFVLFLTICIKALKKAWLCSDLLMSSVLLALLAAFMAHMVFEGWILAPHSIMVVVFWLVIAVIYSNTVTSFQ